jgi:hypothetical protein
VLPASSTRRVPTSTRPRRRLDQRLDFLCRGCRTLREIAHLGCDHREAAALRAGTRRLDRRVQRENIGLKGDAVDHTGSVPAAPTRR